MAVQASESAKTPVIPAEIWVNVAQFVPDTDLCSMISINQVFFQLSMDARYHDLKFDSDSLNVGAMQRLQRVRDPEIAHRVRSLYINLLLSEDYLHELNEEGNLQPARAGISMLEAMNVMTGTVACLTNVTEFSVQWAHSPPEVHLVPFLVAAWKSFGSGLCKLSLVVPAKYLAAVLSTMDVLFALRDLDVKLSGNLVTGETDGEALATVLAPFVNKVAPTLHTLSFSFSNLDVTPLFDHFEEVPNLEQLCIRISHLQTPLESSHVTRFIGNHAMTLRHLDWDERYDHGPSGGEYISLLGDQNYLEFLQGDNLGTVLSDLRSLRIRVPQSPNEFSLLVQHLRFSAETLTSLILLDYDMTLEEVNTVISIFTAHPAGNLKELNLRVEFLSPELILLLAQTLPRLKKLAIYFVRFTGHEAGKSLLEVLNAETYEKVQLEEPLNARIFADTIRKYDLRDWTLYDIGIRGTSLDAYLPEKFMWLLAECVPSVQTFGGEDKTSEFHRVRPEDRL